MPERRNFARSSLARLGVLVGLALAGQFLARWLGGPYLAQPGAPAEAASFAADLILLLCVPFGFFLAPRIPLPVTPLVDRWMGGGLAAHDVNRALYRSSILALVSIAAALAVAMLPHARLASEGISGPAVPLPLGVLLAVAAAFREEIEFRLGLLSVLAWLIGQLLRVARPNGRSVSLWSANLLQAMAFGAVHLAVGAGSGGAALSLPSTVLDPRTISGVILGYAFFSDGLETAIAAHAFRNAAISGLASLFARF